MDSTGKMKGSWKTVVWLASYVLKKLVSTCKVKIDTSASPLIFGNIYFVCSLKLSCDPFSFSSSSLNFLAKSYLNFLDCCIQSKPTVY